MGDAAAYPTGVLISYWDLMRSTWSPAEWGARFDAEGLRRPRLLIDSGVYTARQKNVQINATEYAAWLKSREWQGQLDGAVDVDWPVDQNIIRQHTAILRRAIGASLVLPVLHPFMTTREVEECCAVHSYCAVGAWGVGIATSQARELTWNKDAADKRLRWHAHCHKVAERYDTRLHALGVGCTTEILNWFEWASADASLISICDRYGVVMLWHERERRLKQYLGGARARPEVVKRAAGPLSAARVSLSRAMRDRVYRQGVSAHSIAKMERYYRRRNRHGFRFFVAEKSIEKLVLAYRLAAGFVARKEGV